MKMNGTLREGGQFTIEQIGWFALSPYLSREHEVFKMSIYLWISTKYNILSQWNPLDFS